MRMARAVRAFKTASSMKRLKAIIDKAQHALSTCIFVFFILVLWHIAMALLGMQLFRCNPTEKHLCARANENATCPEYCSELVGDPPTCSFSDSEVFDHCPWDEKRNFNTFPQVCVTERVCVCVCIARDGAGGMQRQLCARVWL